jgi:8-oxo-dGTP diphosphatase
MKTKDTYTYDYPRPAVTCDCVVLGRDSHELSILLIKRRKEPFKDLWAFPGGFLDINEKLEDCAKRELYEETGLEVQHIHFIAMADKPERDPRGRVISAIYTIDVDRTKVNISANDDACDAQWFPISNIPELAFDHSEIIPLVFKYWNLKLKHNN